MKKSLRIFIGLLIICAIVVVGVYAISVLKPGLLKKSSNQREVEMTIEFPQIKKEYIEDIKVGDIIREHTMSILLGEVTEVGPIENSSAVISDYENGKYVEVETPMYAKRKIVIKGMADVGDSTIKFGEMTMKVGNKLGIMFGNNIADGTILGIDVKNNK